VVIITGKKSAQKTKFEVSSHIQVPKHTKVSEKEKKELLGKFNVTLKELPKIHMSDPAISHLDLTVEDIIKVERPSPTTKTTVFYRRVVK